MNRINKKLAVSISLLIITIVLLCSTITLAWFSVQVEDNFVVEIPADSVRMLKFESHSILDSNVLRPAVEKVDGIKTDGTKADGIANNVDYSTIDLVTDTEYLNETATEVTINAPLEVYILPSDENNGGVKVVISLTVTLKNGDSQYEIVKKEDVLEILKFKLYTLENGSSNEITEKVITKSGSKLDIYAKVSLARPQGLLDPILADPDTTLQVNINAKMVLLTGEEVVQSESNNTTLVIPTEVEESH